MIRTWLSFVVVSTLALTSAEAQFARVIGTPEEENVYGAVRLSNGTYLLTGVWKGFPGDSYLATANDDAEIGSVREYDLRSWNAMWDIEPLADGLAVIGIDGGKPFLAHLNDDGTTRWLKEYDTLDSCNRVRDIVVLEGGGFLGTGYVCPGTEDETALAVRFDAGGNIVWRKAYLGSPQPDWTFPTIGPTDIVALGGNRFAILATNQGSPGIGNRIYVMVIDGDGGVIWQQQYVAVYRNAAGEELASGARPGEILPTGDGGLILTSYYFHPMVFKLDGNGKVVWAKEYRSPQVNQTYGKFKAITPANDDGWALAGSIFPDLEHAWWFMKINDSGDVLQEEHVRFDGVEEEVFAQGFLFGVPRQGCDRGSGYMYFTDAITEDGGEDIFAVRVDETMSLRETTCSQRGQMNNQASDVEIRVSPLTLGAISITAESFDVTPSESLVAFDEHSLCGKIRFEDPPPDRFVPCIEVGWDPNFPPLGPTFQHCPPEGCINCLRSLGTPGTTVEVSANLTGMVAKNWRMILLCPQLIPFPQLRIVLSETAIGRWYDAGTSTTILAALEDKDAGRVAELLPDALNRIVLDKTGFEPRHAKLAKQVASFNGPGHVRGLGAARPRGLELSIAVEYPGVPGRFRAGFPSFAYVLKETGKEEQPAYYEVTLSYDGIRFGGGPQWLRLLQWDGRHYQDVTQTVDPVGKTITGLTSGLGPFVIVERGRIGP